MKHKSQTVAAAALVAALTASFAAPVSALAGPGRLGGFSGAPRLNATATAPAATPGTGPNAEQRRAELTTRIENKLRARKARFDAAAANISKRIARVGVLADKVEAAGGNVEPVRAQLKQAEASLASAQEKEAIAVAKWQAVPDATDRRAAIEDAKKAGRAAVEELRDARQNVRDAIRKLVDEIQRLRTQNGTGDEL